jgi:hypothetical protein
MERRIVMEGEVEVGYRMLDPPKSSGEVAPQSPRNGVHCKAHPGGGIRSRSAGHRFGCSFKS